MLFQTAITIEPYLHIAAVRTHKSATVVCESRCCSVAQLQEQCTRGHIVHPV